MPHPAATTLLLRLTTSWYGNCVVLGDKNVKPLADVSDLPASNLLSYLHTYTGVCLNPRV